MKQAVQGKLFDTIQVGAWNLRTRTAMAPMTRCFADETGVVGPDVVEYYRKRAADEIGLIITEGTVISPQGKGNPGVPVLSARSNCSMEKSDRSCTCRGGHDYCTDLACRKPHITN